MLFDETNFGRLKVKNHLVRSATLELGTTPQGELTQEYLNIHKNLAEGGVGLIITGITGIDNSGRIMPKMPFALQDNFITMLSQDCDNVHKNNAKLIVQLVHCGFLAFPTDGSIIVPSKTETVQKMSKYPMREMTKDDISKLIEDYVNAAVKCKESGADGVQIHAAHGFLLSEFLSPFFNVRTDEYGGDIINRTRIIVKIIEAIKSKVGSEFAIMIKMNYSDGFDGGISLQDAIKAAKIFDKIGVDAIEISTGIIGSPKFLPNKVLNSEEDEEYNKDAAIIIAKEMKNASVIVVGGFRSYEKIEKCLQDTMINGISLCRPLICEPDLPKKWMSNPKYKAQCISCNSCFLSDPLSCKRK